MTPEPERYVLGVDVGGTKIHIGFVTRSGVVLRSRRYPMDRSGRDATLHSIFSAVKVFLADDAQMRPTAMGFGLVGRSDPATGTWMQAVNLPISEPVPLAQRMSREYGLPAYVDNDVFSATQAELRFGAGRRYADFLLINVGTGLSCGIVSGGRLVRGAGNVAGEAGQCSLGLAAIGWNDGNHRTLEQCCSGGGMIAQARAEMSAAGSALASLPEGELHAGSIFRLAAEGDPLAKRIADGAVNGLCEATTCLVALFNPAAVVFAGSVACSEGLLGAINGYVRARAFPSSLIDLREVCLSELDARTVGLLGAAQVAWQGLDHKH